MRLLNNAAALLFKNNKKGNDMMIYKQTGIRRLRAKLKRLTVALTVLCLFESAWAADWTAGTGNWFTGGNWSSGVPTAGDFVTINNGGTAQIGAAGAVASQVIMGNTGGESGTISITAGGTLVTNNGAIGFVLGNSGTGTLTISGGGTATTTTTGFADVLFGNTGTGSATIDGAGSTWTINAADSVIFGNGGTGTLTISNGGKVTSNKLLNFGNAAGSNGTLNIGSGGAAGILDAPSVNGGSGTVTLNFNHTDANYFFTDTGAAGGTNVLITGSTAVKQIGTGKTTLTGNNTYSGITTISAGTLQIGNGGTTGTLGSGNVTNDSALIFNRSNASSYAGVISGTGTLTKQGAGVLTLSGANTYSGGTTVSAGTLQGTTSSLQGNITNNANVTFDQSTTGTYSSVISGTGSLIKSNTGTVILSGANTYSGGTTVSGGTLQGSTSSLQGIITNNANVTFDQSTTGTYSSVISGTGSLIKSNTGTVILSGTNTYNGTTTVSAGTLSVNGSIANSTTAVNNGGTLGGTGTVGNVTINNGGTFAPGNSIGTTNVTGNVVFTAGSNYNVEVDAAGNSDKIVATGSATLTGATVNVQPESGTYANVTDYTLLTATGGLGGTTFASVNSNLAFLTPTLSYDANNVFLKLTRNSVNFSSVANTPNQLAVSTVLSNNSTALKSIYNNVLLLTNSGAQQAFDSLSGIQHTQGSVVINQLVQQFQQLLFNHSSQSANGSLAFNNFNPMQGYLLADNTDNWQDVDTDTSSLVSGTRGWWMQGFGGFGNIDDTTNASGADYQSGGLAVGIDTDWRNFVVGVAGSYARSNVDPFAGDSDIDSFQAGAYGSWERNKLYVNATLGLGLHKVDATRTVTVGTSVNTATSDYDSVNVSTAVEAGKDIKLNLDTTLTPYVGINYNHNNRDSFTETGAGTANLNVNEQDGDSLRTTIGLRLSKDIKTKHNKTITPSAMIAYVHEHLDSTSRLEAGFSAVPTSTFRIDGSDLDRDRLQLGVGVSGQLNENTTLNVGYNGELAGSDDHHSFAATVNFVW